MNLFFAILLLIMPADGITHISRINNLKKEAELAYKQQDYAKSAELYKFLLDSMKVDEDAIQMNLANSYFQLKEKEKANFHYSKASLSDNDKIKSRAFQQLGALKAQDQKTEEALSFFKEAMKADPNNTDARYNYELLKNQEKQENKDEQQQDKENQEEQKKDQNQKNKKDQDNNKGSDKDQKPEQKGEKTDEKSEKEKKQDEAPKDGEQDENADPNEDRKKMDDPKFQKKLEEMKISEDKAKMILDAMKNNEIQYIQQNRRKASKPKSSDGPDW